MQLKVLAFAFASCAGLIAQDRPQMIWEGEVDGTSILYIRGKRLDIEDKSGNRIERQRYRFNDALPDVRQNARVQVLQGRGWVQIIQQPRVDNNYTLAVSIEDRQSGPSFYSIALYWDTGGNYSSYFDRPFDRGGDRLLWTGRVDDEAVVECRRDACHSEALRGGPVMRERFKFTRPMPEREVQVSLDDVDGRGEVRLLEQPRANNGYAARVLIRDHQGGAADYGFTLSWTRPARFEPEHLYSQLGMVWYGRVDDTVRVTVQGGSSFSQVMKGQPVMGERAAFQRALPANPNINPQIKKRHGRGHVEVVEFPSNRNGYRLVFEIRDSEGGSDNYEIEVDW